MKHNLYGITFLVLVTLFLASSCKKNVDVNSDASVTTNAISNTSTYIVNVTTIAGKLKTQGDIDGQGNNARFWNPTKMVYDNRNSVLYVADGTVIRSVDKQNNVKTYLPFGKINNYDEILDMDIAQDSIGGTLYFITKENGLYKIGPSGNSYKLTTIADRVYEGNQTGTLNTKDHFDLAHGLAKGKAGDLYFFNTSWNTMHHIKFSSTNPFAGTVQTFVGKPTTTRGGTVWPYLDGQGQTATFGYGVTDMCADGNGNFYVADFRNDLVRKVTPGGIVSSLFQYESGLGIDVDGPISIAQSNRVSQVTANKNGSLIFFSSYGKGGFNPPALRVVKPGIDVSTLVGKSSTYGDGSGNVAAFGEIGGIATTADGKTVYVSEVGNKVIRKVTIQ